MTYYYYDTIYYLKYDVSAFASPFSSSATAMQHGNLLYIQGGVNGADGTFQNTILKYDLATPDVAPAVFATIPWGEVMSDSNAQEMSLSDQRLKRAGNELN